MPAAARSKRADLSIALEAADELAAQWKERGFAFKQPYHVNIPSELTAGARRLTRDSALTLRFSSSRLSSPRTCRISLVSSTFSNW